MPFLEMAKNFLNNEGYNVFLAFVSKKGTTPFTKENLENIFYNK